VCEERLRQAFEYVPAAVAAVLLGLAMAAAPAAAQGAPKGYACTFAKGASQAYAKGSFRARKAEPFTMQIAGIDLAGQRAELVTPSGKGTLRIVLAVGANHFLEAVTEGYLNITTVYSRDGKTGLYPAVHSRHFGLFGEPLIAQYTGTCKAQ
jgi:hypothetical protein